MNANEKKFGETGGMAARDSMNQAADHAAEAAREGAKAARLAAENAMSNTRSKVDDAADAARDTVGDLKDKASDALDEGRSMMGGLIDKATDAKDAVVSGAGSTLAAVRDAAVEKADSARESLSDVGDRLAATLQRASDDDQGDALKSRVLGSVAHGLTQASDALRQRSVADLTSDVKELAKRHPGAFMAVAAVAGFAAARFVRSSAQRRAHIASDTGLGPRV